MTFNCLYLLPTPPVIKSVMIDCILFVGAEMPLNKLSVRGLLPDTEYYMTYDGSTTAPACFETVTWIVINKPIYITKQQVIQPNYEL